VLQSIDGTLLRSVNLKAAFVDRFLVELVNVHVIT
jgi:hypothetical protein